MKILDPFYERGEMMQELEKISEEIRKAFEENTRDIVDKDECHHFVVDVCTATYLVNKIIRKHTKDSTICGDCSRRKRYQEGYKDGKNDNNGWIPVEEWLPEKNEYFVDTSSNKEFPNGYYRRLEIAYMTDTVEYIHGYYDGYKWMDKYLGAIKNVVAWRIHEPYRPERSNNA